MKTFRKSTLISSVALLLVAIVALSGATFAWFSTTSKATANGINATTKQGSNLTVSAQTNTGFDHTIDLAVTKALSPVTTNDLSAWWTAKAEKYNSQKAFGGYTPDTTTENYIIKPVYVKLDAAEGTTQTLKLTVTPTPAKDASDKEIGSLKYYRVAVAPISSTTDANLTDISGYTTKFFADAAINAENASTYYPADKTYANYVTGSFNDQITIGSIDANDVYGFNVYVWFEGEDLDCKDADSINNIDLSLIFE